jgi:UDP-glucose 4-epimerase
MHFATQISVPKSVEDPVFDAKVAILGTINVLENCRKHKVKKIIFSSSAAKYGNPVKLPINEEHPCNAVSQYGVSKRAIELYLAMYHRLYSLDYNALVYANVYGPRQDMKGEAGVIAIFVDTILSGKKCMIFGDGDATRDFVYVKDVARANLLALRSKTASKTINIGSGTKITINALFEKIHSILGKGEAERSAERPGDIKDSYFDISLAKQELRWKPEFELGKGLMETVEWFKSK